MPLICRKTAVPGRLEHRGGGPRMSDWGERMGFVFAAIEVDVGLAVSLGAAVGGLPC